MTGLLIALLVGSALSGQAPSQAPLTALRVLTAPVETLPKGCVLERLAPSPAAASPGSAPVIDVVTGAGFPGNPWSGTDRNLIAAVLKEIDGALSVPNATSNVREAYRATYRDAEGHRVEVTAVTFNDAKLARSRLPAGTSRAKTLSGRLVRGATVIKVLSDIPPNPAASICSEAISTHIGSAK